MATSPSPTLGSVPAGRVVRKLTPGVAPAPSPTAVAIAIGTPRSAFWQDRTALYRQGQKQLSALDNIKEQVGNLGFPASLSVTTSMDESDAVLLTRGVVAMETLATRAGQWGPGTHESCASIEKLSDLAFSLVARITTLSAHLMDLKDVGVSSVIDKLSRNAGLIDQIQHALMALDTKEALALFLRAVDPEPFLSWQKAKRDEHLPELFVELNRRAAGLLATKCLVASQVEGEDPNWPPAKAAAPAQPNP